ncbi:MAG: acetyl-CoA carboxylase, carboxyltransferase subunit beta [Ignavibacteriales bacterium]|nr:MAG: acetyl-CoA carboxylase carboxyltransferase subunit beta [Ignavibacteriaceae bacterium]MBW7872310.1 acetyl-CoA carboxylase carboxyltransferase subunit beta [Ignavibacteria bacterium]MCZ2142593.1 acetyl-CoA carboxylase, carboxyltransferase subunit beta [Ignavibacteriales bacterium]OQY76243.1 MAG: acetyl-CoA carboxylase carboxyl transferase subunit beta [Ignavibacteriales bacterium UTCHB3]MBV6445543.1 Acetyl-coenzyme A carboxylase carboxyl transferase subunit beta [Ignavibacteriaceae bacte
MAWFKRQRQNITTETPPKDNLPDGLWEKCPQCGEIMHKKQVETNLWTCIKCNNHFRIGSAEYFAILIDEGTFKEYDKKMRSADPLKFEDTKKYTQRIENTIKATGLLDAVRTGTGKLMGRDVVIGCMDFKFIGGSMGSVVGEKLARATHRALKGKMPLIIISSSGGARMMEGALSLMQMAKTSARLAQLADAKIPFISVLTDPTTGGTTASYAMLGDVIIAEPNALIGFAGPRVIKQTIGRDLPEGFQRAEFVLDHGFVDTISHRKELKQTISNFLDFLQVKKG